MVVETRRALTLVPGLLEANRLYIRRHRAAERLGLLGYNLRLFKLV